MDECNLSLSDLSQLVSLMIINKYLDKKILRESITAFSRLNLIDQMVAILEDPVKIIYFIEI